MTSVARSWPIMPGVSPRRDELARGAQRRFPLADCAAHGPHQAAVCGRANGCLTMKSYELFGLPPPMWSIRPLYSVPIVNGCRRNEAADMTWTELGADCLAVDPARCTQ